MQYSPEKQIVTMQEILLKRLDELGMTRYQVAKAIADKQGRRASDITTRVSQTFEHPESRQYANLADVIEVLGGRALPGYYTVAEIATELKRSEKWVLRKITGRHPHQPELRAYLVNRIYLVPEAEAIAFIQRYR